MAVAPDLREPHGLEPDLREHTRRPERRARVAVLALIGLLGALTLPRALGGDQALFVSMARSMHDGAVLYRDIWDAKQPGIYLFYLAAGSAFGFDEIGVHLAELCVMLVLAAVLQRTLPDLGVSRRAATFAPLFTVLPYYLVATTWDLTQLEPLIGLPLYLMFWTSIRARASTTHQAHWQCAAGLCAAVITVFKLLYAPFGLLFLALSLRRDQRVRAAAAWLGGVALVWLPVFAWVAAHGLVHEVWYTWIRFPATSRSQAAQPLSTLTDSARSFGRSYAPLLVLAAYGVWSSRHRIERWMVLALGWAAMAVALDLTQFWWRYLYWDAAVPIGLFALLGAAALVELFGRDRRRAVALSAVALLLTAAALSPQRARFQDALTNPIGAFEAGDAHDRLQRDEEPTYGTLDETLAVLRAPNARAGAIVVFGTPIIQLESGRRQAGRIPGFLANTLGSREWTRFAAQMRADPPAYVFIGSVQGVSEQEFLDTRGVEVDEILKASYCDAGTVPEGRWLVQCQDIDAPSALRRDQPTPP